MAVSVESSSFHSVKTGDVISNFSFSAVVLGEVPQEIIREARQEAAGAPVLLCYKTKEGCVSGSFQTLERGHWENGAKIDHKPRAEALDLSERLFSQALRELSLGQLPALVGLLRPEHLPVVHLIAEQAAESRKPAA